MKKELFVTIEIPEDVEFSLDENELTAKGPQGELKKTFNFGRLQITHEGNTIVIGSKKATKIEKKLMNTLAAHIRNMITGVKEKFEYELKICSGHFPMTTKQEGDTVVIKNFLGEKVERRARVLPGVEMEMDKEKIVLKSVDKDLVGQTAANFEKATKIKARDNRIFQDGIYIIKKNGKEI